MLVLSRKVGEEIVIGDNIRVTVVSMSGNRVKLGFTAPGHTSIHRAEVHRNIQAEAAMDVHTGRPVELAACI